MGALYLALHFSAFSWLASALGAATALAAAYEWAAGRLSLGRAVVSVALGILQRVGVGERRRASCAVLALLLSGNAKMRRKDCSTR